MATSTNVRINVKNAFTFKGQSASIEIYGCNTLREVYISLNGAGFHVSDITNPAIKLKASSAARKALIAAGHTPYAQM